MTDTQAAGDSLADESGCSQVSVADILASEWPYRFAEAPNGSSEGYGGCPCCLIHGSCFEVRVHCWRTCDQCEFSGIHISGSVSDEEKMRIAEYIRDHNGWTEATEWQIVFE